jgi:hypothetical protein
LLLWTFVERGPERRSQRDRATKLALVSLLNVHLWVGIVVALFAVVAIWRTPDRRITLYVVTLQILIGVVLVIEGLRAPSIHYALAVLGFAGYMVANALARRGRSRAIVLTIAIVSSVLVLLAFMIGHGAVTHGFAG